MPAELWKEHTSFEICYFWVLGLSDSFQSHREQEEEEEEEEKTRNVIKMYNEELLH